MPIQARRLDQSHGRRHPLARAPRAGKEPVLAQSSGRPALDRHRVHGLHCGNHG